MYYVSIWFFSFKIYLGNHGRHRKGGQNIGRKREYNRFGGTLKWCHFRQKQQNSTSFTKTTENTIMRGVFTKAGQSLQSRNGHTDQTEDQKGHIKEVGSVKRGVRILFVETHPLAQSRQGKMSRNHCKILQHLAGVGSCDTLCHRSSIHEYGCFLVSRFCGLRKYWQLHLTWSNPFNEWRFVSRLLLIFCVGNWS